MSALQSIGFRLREFAFVARQRRRLDRLAAYHRPGTGAQAMVDALRGKTVVFTVTAGRTGTTYLTHLLALCPDTTSLHEPEPSFVPIQRLVQRDPALARRFLLEYKLPFIAEHAARRYVETGHLFCKGFLEPLLDLGIVPHLILLRRSPRRIATSLLARRTVPGRGKLGLKYLVHPEDPGVLALPGWLALTDYQLCFWYALEIERRQERYATTLERVGGHTVDVTAEELHDAGRFLAVAEHLALLDPDSDRSALLARHAEVSRVTHNPNPSDAVPTLELDAQEAAVWKAIAPHAPALRERVTARYR
jgi:hypothetical protein